jgi:hypothetical protein
LNGTLASNYGLLANSSDVACGPLADFCMSGADPVFDGYEACLPNYFTSDGEGCQRIEDCGAQMPLTDASGAWKSLRLSRVASAPRAGVRSGARRSCSTCASSSPCASSGQKAFSDLLGLLPSLGISRVSILTTNPLTKLQLVTSTVLNMLVGPTLLARWGER